jgi:signal transduction histidine kinase/CheY-like chemotaxis protein
MTLALLSMTIISLWGALFGSHPPPTTPMTLSQRIFSTEVLDLILAVIFFMLVSVEEQRKQVIKQLRRNAARLQDALEIIRGEEKAKNEFIATLAHELRNPLATLISSTELLAIDTPQKSEARELIDIMHGKILTMGKLLDDLLDIARITRKELVLRKESVLLSDLVRRALETVGHRLQRKEQTLNVSIPIEAIVLEADPMRLEQVFVNLLGNAIKYTPAHGHIDFTAKYIDKKITIRVADNGIGIPESMLDRIFDPFVQVRSENQPMTEGMGIGLALTKTLIELHGGSIYAKPNVEGKGTAFIIILPANAEEPSFAKRAREMRPPSIPIAPVSLFPEGLRILVVDDNEDAARGLAKLLSLKGYNVSVAYTGEDALEKLETETPHVVFLDLGLPDISGIEVAIKIQERDESPILVALTGYGQESDRQQTKDAGFQFHLTKPVGLKELEEVIVASQQPA